MKNIRAFNVENNQVVTVSPLEQNIRKIKSIWKNLTNPTWEHQLLDLYRETLETGNDRLDRTNTGTRAIFGPQYVIDLKKGFPLVTTKKMGLKSIIAELLWFLEGSNDERRLAELTHGTRDPAKRTIWTDNANADYWKPKAQFEGDLGRIYGVQWRSWTNKDGKVLDQLQEVISKLRNNPFDRRIIISAWNPGEFDQMALPPCHAFMQFFVRQDGEGRKHLSCKMYQRSIDCFLGKSYNIASYAALVHMLAHITGMEVDKLIMTDGDFHIYGNHFEQVQEQITRKPFAPPTLRFKDPETLKEISDFTVDSFILENYQYHPAIKAPMAV